MRRNFGFRFFSLALCLASLAACQGAKPAAKEGQVSQVPDKAPEATAPFLGTWYVTDAFPTKEVAPSAIDSHVGVRLVVESALVSDIDGQSCRSPVLALDEMPKRELVAQADGTLPRLKVACDGKDFSTLVALPKGGLLSLRPDGAYLLERGERVTYRAPSERAAMPGEGQIAASVQVPAGAPEQGAEKPRSKPAAAAPVELMPALPAPVAEGPEGAPTLQSMTGLAAAETAKPIAQVEGNVPKLGSAVHLASYKGLKAAKRGWKILLGDNDELDPLSPLYVQVEIAGKGKMIRLYATGADPKELSHICKALVVKGVYCALNP